MQKLHFSIFIDAPKEKVWHTMLDKETYREWTAAFGGESDYRGGWNQGSKILFVAPNKETGKDEGMVSRIAANKPYEFISIEHLGLMRDGVEDTTSEEAKKWTPAFENYTFTEKDGGTELIIDVDVEDSMADEFRTMWPDGLARLKTIAEGDK